MIQDLQPAGYDDNVHIIPIGAEMGTMVPGSVTGLIL